MRAVAHAFVLSLLFLVRTMFFLAAISDAMSCVTATSTSEVDPSAALRAFRGIAMRVMAVMPISTGSGGISCLQSFIVVMAVPVSLVLPLCLRDARSISLMLGKKV